MNKPQTLKGFRDFLPDKALKRKWLREKISQVFELWGYDPLETPSLEAVELFAGQIGEDEKLFYQFKDPGGREVALRYDQTVPTCRVVGQYNQELVFPFKRYQIQPAFRAENPQKGRYREFLQCDADIFGIDSPQADAEVIALSLDIYRQLGFSQVQVRINDRALLGDFPYPVIAAIDKLEKIGEQGVIKELEKKGISLAQARDYLHAILQIKPNETIQVILAYLKQYGFAQEWYTFDPTIARSFSYSTGPIWEVKVAGFSGSVLGGERFDKLVGKVSGNQIPGTGFGLGFDRTYEAAEQFNLLPAQKTNTVILMTIFQADLQGEAIRIVRQLREAGIAAELYPDLQTKLDKQLKYADRKGIPYVIIQGPDELKRKALQLKDLSAQTQQTLKLDQVLSKFTQN